MDRREICRPHSQTTPIIPREVQTSEAQGRTNNMLQNSRKKKH